MRPPSTACSASMECGGVRTSATGPASRCALAGPATDCPADRNALRLFLGSDRDVQRHVDVRMQVQMHYVLADHAKRAAGQPHFAARDLEALARTGFRDIRGANRAEQFAFSARLRGDREAKILHRFG